MKRKLNVDIMPSIRRLEVITKGLLKTRISGGYGSVFKGKGLEFSEYRVYSFDDDSLTIDWKASMRANQLLVRQYVEEKDINVFFLVDCSSSMVFGSAQKLKNEYSVELVASLAYAILEAGDSVGLAMFNDQIVEKVYPGKGKKQFYSLVKTLIKPENYQGSYDFVNAAKFLLNYLKDNVVVVVVSDFIGLKGEWTRFLEMLSSKYDVIGVMVRDIRDKELPGDVGQVVIEDPYSDRSLLIEPDLIKEVYKSEIKRQESEIKSTFLKNRSDFLSLTTNQGFIKPVITMFKERALKWR